MSILTAVFIALAMVGGAAAQTAGTTYPSQKLVFQDPLSGKTVWRMTTAGNHRMPSDQTQESHSFSPDSTRIVYQKSDAGSRPNGVYSMDLVTGEETLVVPGAPWYSAPIYSRDGAEVYYFTRPSSSTLRVMAAKTSAPWTTRTLASLSAEWQEKLAVNSDGTRVSASVRLTGSSSSWRIVILSPFTGAILSGWGTSGPSADDGAAWSPTDPDLVCASRAGTGQERVWNVVTLQSYARCTSAHAAWHPNGLWYVEQGYVKNALTGAAIIPGTGIYPIHHNINPTEAALGVDATLLSDDRDWFSNNTGRPRLYRPTLRQLATGNYRPSGALLAVHYSKMSSNGGHVHAQWSPNGAYVAWQSDLQDLRDGTPPGGISGQAIFVLPMAVVPPPVTRFPVTLSVSGAGSGATTGAGTYTVGVTVTLTATPAADSLFDGWSPAPCAPTFPMPAGALECVATFSLIPPPPPPPGAVALNGSLDWSSVPGATGYVVERQINGGDWTPLATVTESFTPLPPPVPDCFRVRALGPGGLGEPGPAVCR